MKCDGIVNCVHGEDEEFELCQSTFPETATIRCQEIDRGSYNVTIDRWSYDITILATPCNGIRECLDIDDEDCGESTEVLITSLVIVFIVILAVCGFVHHTTTKQYPTMISDDPEFVDDETAKYRSGLKGNILAQIKVINVFLI